MKRIGGVNPGDFTAVYAKENCGRFCLHMSTHARGNRFMESKASHIEG